MIRADWGYSLILSGSSGGIPSPIRESKDFKKLLDFKEDEAGSSFNSWKIKKIEFSDDQNKHKKTPKNKKKKNKSSSHLDEQEEDCSIDHTLVDKIVFSNDLSS